MCSELQYKAKDCEALGKIGKEFFDFFPSGNVTNHWRRLVLESIMLHLIFLYRYVLMRNLHFVQTKHVNIVSKNLCCKKYVLTVRWLFARHALIGLPLPRSRSEWSKGNSSGPCACVMVTSSGGKEKNSHGGRLGERTWLADLSGIVRLHFSPVSEKSDVFIVLWFAWLQVKSHSHVRINNT